MYFRELLNPKIQKSGFGKKCHSVGFRLSRLICEIYQVMNLAAMLPLVTFFWPSATVTGSSLTLALTLLKCSWKFPGLEYIENRMTNANLLTYSTSFGSLCFFLVCVGPGETPSVTYPSHSVQTVEKVDISAFECSHVSRLSGVNEFCSHTCTCMRMLLLSSKLIAHVAGRTHACHLFGIFFSLSHLRARTHTHTHARSLIAFRKP